MRKLTDFIRSNRAPLEHGEAALQAFITLLRALDDVPEKHRNAVAGSALVSLATILFNWVPLEDLPNLLEAVLERCPDVNVGMWPSPAPSSQAKH